MRMQITLIAALALAVTMRSEAAPSLSPGEVGVIVEGVVSDAGVAVFGFERRTEDEMTRRVGHAAIVPDNDRDSVVRYGNAAIDRRSVWFAVDLGSGEIAFHSPIAIPAIELPSKAFPRGPNGLANLLAMDRLELEIAVVRPGQGMWTLSIADGGPADEDGVTNGRLRVDMRSMNPVLPEFGVAPQSYRDGDVIIAIDPQNLASHVGVIGRNGK